MKAALLSLAFLAAVASPVAALDPGGTLAGVAGAHGVEVSILDWQSDYTRSGAGGNVSLMTRGDLAGDADLGGASIGIEIGDLAERRINRVELVIRVKSNTAERFRATEEDGLRLTLDAAVIEGELLKIAGEIEGVLTRETIVPRKRDPSRTLPVKLRFDAVVAPLE